MMRRRTFIKVAGGWMAASFGAPALFAQAQRGGQIIDLLGSRGFRSAPLNARPDMSGVEIVEGTPFRREFTGDRFGVPGQHPPFPSLGEWIGYGKAPPAPDTSADIVIVGGGLAGLCAAYLLREHRPLLLEHNSRFGGNSQGEVWRDLPYSLGGAYCIEPDEPLASLYKELGLDQVVRITPGPPNSDPVEFNGKLIENFWYGAGQTPEVAAQFVAFADLVNQYADNYPDIPLTGKNDQYVRALDRVTLKQDVEDHIGPVPPILEALIQHYCWSSFGGGWQELSAAAGWNFLAAEQFGQWVFPGGTAQIAQRLWAGVRAASGHQSLRTEHVALDVRPLGNDYSVTFGMTDGSVRAVRARRVVMACPKFVCKAMMHPLLEQDPGRLGAIEGMDYRAYVVANVLLNRGVPDTFYDAFFLEDGQTSGETIPEWREWHRPLDAVSAGWTLGGTSERAVLTLYWPLPFGTARGLLLGDQPFPHFAERLLAHIDPILAAVQARRSDIEQVRLTRWGHALPLAAPNFIADGHAERVRAPIDGRIFFVNQDNWALPAVETSLLEAFHWAPQIAAGL